MFLNCNNVRNKIQNENAGIHGHLRFSFKELSKIEAENCLGRAVGYQLYSLPAIELKEIYIVEVQNVSIDSIVIRYNSVAEGLPIYYPSTIKYFQSLSDSMPFNVSSPFNIPNKTYKLGKNEKKCFLTTFKLDKNIAKLEYKYHIDDKDKDKGNSTIELILVNQNNQIFDMTEY